MLLLDPPELLPGKSLECLCIGRVHGGAGCARPFPLIEVAARESLTFAVGRLTANNDDVLADEAEPVIEQTLRQRSRPCEVEIGRRCVDDGDEETTPRSIVPEGRVDVARLLDDGARSSK